MNNFHNFKFLFIFHTIDVLKIEFLISEWARQNKTQILWFCHWNAVKCSILTHPWIFWGLLDNFQRVFVESCSCWIYWKLTHYFYNWFFQEFSKSLLLSFALSSSNFRIWMENYPSNFSTPTVVLIKFSKKMLIHLFVRCLLAKLLLSKICLKPYFLFEDNWRNYQ